MQALKRDSKHTQNVDVADARFRLWLDAQNLKFVEAMRAVHPEREVILKQPSQLVAA